MSALIHSAIHDADAAARLVTATVQNIEADAEANLKLMPCQIDRLYKQAEIVIASMSLIKELVVKQVAA